MRISDASYFTFEQPSSNEQVWSMARKIVPNHRKYFDTIGWIVWRNNCFWNVFERAVFTFWGDSKT